MAAIGTGMEPLLAAINWKDNSHIGGEEGKEL